MSSKLGSYNSNVDGDGLPLAMVQTLFMKYQKLCCNCYIKFTNLSDTYDDPTEGVDNIISDITRSNINLLLLEECVMG